MLNISILALIFSLFLAPKTAESKERAAELMRYAVKSINQENYIVAQQTLDKVISFESNNIDALFLRAYCKHMTGKDEDALPDLDKVIRLNDQYTNAYIIRARVNRALGNYWSALKDYNKARQQDPYLTFFSLSKGRSGEKE